MSKIKSFVLGSILVTGLVLSACSARMETTEIPAAVPTETSAPLPPTEADTGEPTPETAPETSKRTSFEQLGISLEVPEGLTVTKDPIVNLDDPSKLQAYTFYIQNYGASEGPGEDYFQMYGHLQFGLPSVTWEQYKSDILNSSEYTYATEIEVNGLPGLDSQLGGQRNRFVYHFMLDGRVLNIAVSDPNQENKALADQIISTLEFTPGSVTDDSLVQLVNEPNGFYQMYLPEDWEYTFNPPAGIRLSDLEAHSPDAEVVVEKSDGPHDTIYYNSGVTLNIAVLDDDSALSEPAMAQIASSTPIMIAGISGNDYRFIEPSTAAGEIREVRYFHNGKSFLVRFSYGANADQEQLDWLIRNLVISQ